MPYTTQLLMVARGFAGGRGKGGLEGAMGSKEEPALLPGSKGFKV